MKQLPMEMAAQYAAIKAKEGSLEKAAKVIGTAPSTLSRYIALLNLPKEIQQRVNTGELPLANPKKAALKKENPSGRTMMSDLDKSLLDVFVHCRFITHQQCSRYINKSASQTKVGLDRLKAMGLLQVNKEFSPFAYALSSKGYAMMGLGKPKHFISAHAIHQSLMRNQVEIEMREKNNTAHFLNRTRCWSMGLYPATAEHLVSFQRTGQQEYALVLIDDYQMAPNRIFHSLQRKHDQKKAKVSSDLVLCWKDMVSIAFIYASTSKQKEQHEKFILNNKNTLPLTVIVRETAPIWRVL